MSLDIKEPSEHDSSPETDSLHPSDWLLFAFVTWTVSCHATILTGGSLHRVLLLFAVLWSTALCLLWRLRPRLFRTVEEADQLQPFPEAASERQLGLRTAGLMFALLGSALVAAFGDPLFFWCWWVGLTGVALVLTVRTHVAVSPPPQATRHQTVALSILALAALLVALVMHRPDEDDAFYANVAVSAADHPTSNLLKFDTLHGIEGLPLHLSTYRVHSYELLHGAISYLTGLPAIYSFHWFATSIAAFLLPFALAQLYKLLVPRQWLWAVAATLLVLVAVGDVHRWTGNFSLVRLWQGKAIFVSLLVPLLFVYGIRFSQKPTWLAALRLAGAQIASIGLSASALWAAPFVAGAALVTGMEPTWRGVRTVAVGLLCSGYTLMAGWMMKEEMRGFVARSAREHSPEPAGTQLALALEHGLGSGGLLIFTSLVLFGAWALTSNGLSRRFALVPALLSALLLLNPFIEQSVVRHITGPSLWRALWTIPIPHVAALVLIAPLAWSRRMFLGRLLTVVSLAAFLSLVPKTYGWNQDKLRLGLPTLKVHVDDYETAKELVESAEPATQVIAPLEVSLWIPTFHQHPYPLRVRRYLHSNAKRVGEEAFRNRLQLERYVSSERKKSKGQIAMFQQGLDRFAPTALALRRRTDRENEDPFTAELLVQEGFQLTRVIGDYQVWSREASVASSDKGEKRSSVFQR